MKTKAQMQLLDDSPSIRSAIAQILDADREQARILMTSMNIHDFRLDRETSYLRNALSKLLSKKSRVTILIGGGKTPDRLPDELQGFYTYLIDLGANIFFNKRMHAKTMMALSRSGNCLLITSANFTQSGLYDNYEIGALCDDSQGNVYERLEHYITERIERSRPIEHWIGEQDD